jgi:hypothetical protein
MQNGRQSASEDEIKRYIPIYPVTAPDKTVRTMASRVDSAEISIKRSM